MAHLYYSARLSEDVVESVAGNPDHAGEGHQQTKYLRPLGVGVVVSIGDGGVGDAVEDEHHEHDSRSKVFPAEKPEHVWFVTSHLLHTVTEPDKQ